MEQTEPPQSQLPQKYLWVDNVSEVDEDDEEVGVRLLARSSRHPTNGVGTTPTTTTTTTGSELEPVPALAPTNGKASSEHVDQEEEVATTDRNEEVGDENEEDKVAKRQSDETTNSVYFDKLEGIWKCRHCNWTHQIGSPCILDVQIPKGYLQMVMNSKTLNQSGLCFTLETKGTESVNGISEMLSEIPKILSMEVNNQLVKNVEDQNSFGLNPPPVEYFHEESSKSFKHFDNAIKVDANADLTGEIEEDLMELDVEKVLEKQNTHDLYCPNCNSCITRRVILCRKPRISNRRHKPKPGKKLDVIPNSKADGQSGDIDTPEISSNVPTMTSDEQNNGTAQDQEAFSCLSCFSLFIPIGNGCFKIFQFFRQIPQEISQRENTESPQEIGQRENIQSPEEINLIGNSQSPQEISRENIQTPQEIGHRENIQSPRGIEPIENTRSPQEGSQKEKAQILQGIGQNENRKPPQKVSQNEDKQSPLKRSRNENTHGPQLINQNVDAQHPPNISRSEDRQSPQNTSHDEKTQSPHDINHSESKQSPHQNISTNKANWLFSIFAFHKGKATVEKVQSAAVPRPSVTNGEHIDGAAIKPEESGTSKILSSTNISLPDEVKAESREEADADMFRRNAGDNEIQDIEAGLLESTLHPRTEAASSSQSGTQGANAGEAHEWEILKSIIYGGLVESITSLGVVSSAAGAGADTLNVLALGLANLIGGLVIIGHNLRELKNDQPRAASTEINAEEDRYQVLLGRRQNFALHVTVAILSFLIFGLVPPVVYGFSFRKSDDKDLKLAAVAGASLACIILLALGKAHVRKPRRTYFRTVSYYVILGITASAVSYLVGELIKKLLEQLGLFESSSAVSVPFWETMPLEVGRASY